MKYKKAMFSLPEPLIGELEKYSQVLNNGNKSGFVSQAVAEKIEYLRKAYHTQKLREAYAAAAKDSLRLTKEWEPLDDELWRRLDAIETGKKRR